MKPFRTFVGTCVLAIAVLAPAMAPAQAVLYGVGDLPGGIVFSDVRDATKVNGVIYAVGGTSSKAGENNEDTAYLWTSTGGMTALPDLAPDLTDTNAIIASAITRDARYIASRARFNPNNSFNRHAVRVTVAGLTSIDLGALPGFPNSAATAISADGSILYGFATYAPGKSQAVRYTVAGPGITAIPFAVAGDDTSGPAGRGTSADGTVMVGTSTNSAVDGGDSYGAGNHAFRYVQGSGVSTIPYLSGGTWNAAMAVSPDGNLVAYFSEKDFYFVDLYLADANTGKVKKRLLKSSYSSNYETYRFINSAASGSPDGKYIAIAAKRGPRDEIVIIDVAKNSEYRRIRVKLNGVTTPAWSPDGRQLVFAGYDGGLSDLFIVDVAGGGLVRLTNDKYADLNPVWSPDGKTIAFATDRGPETDFATLRIGNTRIAPTNSGKLTGLTMKALTPSW